MDKGRALEVMQLAKTSADFIWKVIIKPQGLHLLYTTGLRKVVSIIIMIMGANSKITFDWNRIIFT